MRSERRRREGESKIFKLTCIPTLLAAPPPKQYSTSTLIPPATQAMGIATQKYRKIPKISPEAYIFQRPFLRGLFFEGLIFGGAYLRREICVSKSIGLAL